MGYSQSCVKRSNDDSDNDGDDNKTTNINFEKKKRAGAEVGYPEDAQPPPACMACPAPHMGPASHAGGRSCGSTMAYSNISMRLASVRFCLDASADTYLSITASAGTCKTLSVDFSTRSVR